LNFGQTIWDEIEGAIGNALRTHLQTFGTSREHHENMLKTHWEQGRKTKNNSTHPTPPHPQKERTGPIMSAC